MQILKAVQKKQKSLGLWGLLSAVLFIVGLLTVGGFFSRFWWPLDIASGFRLQYVEVGLVAAAIYGVGRHKRHVGAALLVVAVNGALIVPMYLGGSTGSGMATCRMLFANVRSENTGYERLLELVRTEKPDVIILAEVNQDWVDALSELREGYPHHVEYPKENHFGIAFYTKLPVQSMEIKIIGKIQVASVHAVIEHGGVAWNIIGTHSVPPVGGAYWRWRNNQLDELASYLQSLDEHVVVLGDLNLPPWSHYFRKFARDAKLRDGDKGFGLHISWPTFFPLLGIPIDHCLVSPGIIVRNRWTGPEIGSDHYPVIVDLALSEPSGATNTEEGEPVVSVDR